MSDSQQPSKGKVIAAIPCFNTERFIGNVVSQTVKYVDQVIVIDDGSTDNTVEIARTAGAVVISHGMNKGYGEAIKSCLEAGRTNAASILVTLDGDGQHNPDQIPALLVPIRQGDADMVIGSRFLNDEVKIPAYRRFGIQVITFLFNVGSHAKVSDAQSGFRAYSQKALGSIWTTEAGMSISVETIIKARKAGLRIKEVPISCQYHRQSSTKNPMVHGLSVALAVIRLRLKAHSDKATA
ncbi:MAG: glycosyltransferase family 2 protein [Chloroflexota bacterium]